MLFSKPQQVVRIRQVHLLLTISRRARQTSLHCLSPVRGRIAGGEGLPTPLIDEVIETIVCVSHAALRVCCDRDSDSQDPGRLSPRPGLRLIKFHARALPTTGSVRSPGLELFPLAKVDHAPDERLACRSPAGYRG
jgi:hypothetical protein